MFSFSCPYSFLSSWSIYNLCSWTYFSGLLLSSATSVLVLSCFILTHSWYHYASLCYISWSETHSTARLLHTKMVQLFNTWYTSLSREHEVDKSRSDDVAIRLPTPAQPWWAWSSQIIKIKGLCAVNGTKTVTSLLLSHQFSSVRHNPKLQ